ncbi:uncharacterized protein LOC112682376 [Sipha flava]|uniref:Borealin n=1 Tax=Sipha flava TaxID=143950 RepID=A0A2S2RAK5_9HEMI|nr:uncharacterized protein LOC112682376 [Sipha flava]XP_025408737.1 uncharacterized protein LOC112682376 [Sipha flava]
MPRTKRRTVRQTSGEFNLTANSTIANQPKNIKEILNEFDTEKNNIEIRFAEAFEDFRNKVENAFLMVKINLSGSMNMNLYDYIAQCNAKKSNNVVSSTSKINERPSRNVTRTAENKTARQQSASNIKNKTNSSSTVIKHRSATRHEDKAPLEKNESKFKTPVNKPIPIFPSVTVTPKVNMNEPISVMRRPNQGEVALSMTGSPLMVSSVSRDDMATVSVPLANGNVLSILPRAGATMDVSFDEQTKSELLLLKGNIEGLLNKNRRV